MRGVPTTLSAAVIDAGWADPSALDVGLAAVGWLVGWFMLWRLRPLPPPTPDGSARRTVAVVVPARNEARQLPELLPALVAQLGAGDELVVVDDHSDDGTADVAAGLGASVAAPPPLPDGWRGKPHACWHGAQRTSADVLLFVDADVRPPPDLLDRAVAAIEGDPEAVVSVEPWHDTRTAVEQASLLFNVTSLMGSGAFTALGDRVRSPVAYGPVLALRRDVYDRVGGHAAPTVRVRHTEDIGLARAVGRSELFTGRPDIRFRMYPGGLGQILRGWTRTIATGAGAAPWWATLATLVWVWSLAGGWVAVPIMYPLTALQVWVLGRRAGSIHPLTALLFPLAVIVLVVVFVASLFALVTRRDVAWKGRRVPARNVD